MHAEWTPDADAGSIRFSTNYRRSVGEDVARWSRRDRPWWIPEEAAALMDEHDLPDAALLIVAVAVLLIARAIVSSILSCCRARRSESVAQELLREADAPAPPAAGHAVLPAPTGLLVRYCRFCDVPIEDDAKVDAHLGGKRHAKLVVAAGALAKGDWWCMRAAPETARGGLAAPAAASADEAAAPAPTEPDTAVLSRTGGGDGGKGKWSTAQPRRRK